MNARADASASAAPEFESPSLNPATQVVTCILAMCAPVLARATIRPERA